MLRSISLELEKDMGFQKGTDICIMGMGHGRGPGRRGGLIHDQRY